MLPHEIQFEHWPDRTTYDLSPRPIGKTWACLLLACCLGGSALAQASWQAALDQMPLTAGTQRLDPTNCVEVMLNSFRSNQVVKAIVFMPGATDEFYMFRRARAKLSQPSPTLLDAVSALTNQTLIQSTFRSPWLLLHTEEDLLETEPVIRDSATVERLKHTRFNPHLVCNDRDWDAIQPIFKWTLKVDVRPWRGSTDSWHFYRHSFAAWGLDGWEALETAALAGRSRFTVSSKRVAFEVDSRNRAAPPGNPKR